MRTDVIKLLPEGIKPLLLRGHIRLRRSCRVRLQRAVHPLMPPILLWMARFDQIRTNPQTNPPDRQRGQPSQRNRREWRPIIRANAFRQAIRLKDPAKFCLGRLEGGRREGQNTQDIATPRIRDRQRIAIDAVQGFELAFEICRPQLIRGGGKGVGFAGCARCTRLRRAVTHPFCVRIFVTVVRPGSVPG